MDGNIMENLSCREMVSSNWTFTSKQKIESSYDEHLNQYISNGDYKIYAHTFVNDDIKNICLKIITNEHERVLMARFVDTNDGYTIHTVYPMVCDSDWWHVINTIWIKHEYCDNCAMVCDDGDDCDYIDLSMPSKFDIHKYKLDILRDARKTRELENHELNECKSCDIKIKCPKFNPSI